MIELDIVAKENRSSIKTMDLGFVLWTIFLHFLIMMCSHGSKAREMAEHWKEQNEHYDGRHVVTKWTNVLQLQSVDVDNLDVKHSMDGHLQLHMNHMSHMDPSLLVFFTVKDLKVGKTMPIYFPKRDPSSSPHFLPREEAASIPFSSTELPNLLKFFSFTPGSPQAKAMEDTLRECETKPIRGETKFCATSLESMLDFTRGIFGMETQFTVLSTAHLTKSITLLQNYTILESPERLTAPKMVACHTMPYPFAVFYCHYQESESKIFKVSLHGENGDRVEAVAVCHMDTSQWSRDHVSFRVLGIEPGTSPVCHFFPADNLVWLPSHT